MNCEIYKITITPSPPQIIEPIINVLDRNIFKSQNKTRLCLPKMRKPSPSRNRLDEELTKKIRQHSPFKEVWREIIKPNFKIKGEPDD